MRVEYQKPLVLFGAGPFAELMLYHFRHDTKAEIAAITVDRKHIVSDSLYGLPVTAFEDIETKFPTRTHDLFLAIGYKRMRDRKSLFDRAKSRGYKLVNFISSHSLVHDLEEIGENNVMLDHALVEPFSSIGSNNIFWSGAVLCHGSRVGDHNFIAAGTLLGGGCVIGNGCFLGFGTTVLDKIKIADETLLGARSLVLRDTRAYTKYLGSPAVAAGIHQEEGIVILR